MFRCLSCLDVHSETACPQCGWSPTVVEGFATYAPELARGGGGYDAGIFDDLAPLEEASFWFRSRNALIQSMLREAAGTPESFFEIGCGSGFVLAGVGSAFPGTRLVGSEIFVEGLAHARRRLPDAELIQVDARALPYAEEFDAIGAFDVLEHIAEDEQVLAEVHRALRPGGTLIVSVPQHRWLWSSADDYAHHVRRYTGTELRTKVTDAGFEILRDTSFVSLLLPLMLVSRVVDRLLRRPYDPRREMQINPGLNALLGRVMRLERWLIRRGVRFPVGGSRLVVARRLSRRGPGPGVEGLPAC